MQEYKNWKSLVDLQEYPAIPDSAILHYPMDEGDGQTLNDNEGNSDASLNFENWVSNNYEGGVAKEFDGNDDSGTAPFHLNDLSEFAIAVTVETQSSDGTICDWDDLSYAVQQIIIGGGNLSGGHVGIRIGDGSSIIEAVSTTQVDDGNKYRVVGTYKENEEIAIHINGTEEDSSNIGEKADSGEEMNIGKREDNSVYYRGVIDNMIIYNSVDVVQDDYDIQPWS